MTANHSGLSEMRRETEPLGFASRAVLGLVAALLLALLAAWQVTPRLDWARYRQGISAFAAQRLGRQVSIDGPIHLALLPHPELTARDVALADRGDGISARIGALRLTVATLPLLRGRLVPLRLQLDDPVITAPWPLPGGTARVPAVARGFGAHLDGGTLHLGAVTVTAIDADIHADPDTGAFSATGAAVAGGGDSMRFSAYVGAPSADGAAVLSLTLDGLNRLVGTGAVLHGRRAADGTIDGALRASGPDFSRLMPGPAAAWSVQGPVSATDGVIRAANLPFLLDNSPGVADLTWRLMPSAHVDATVKFSQISLGAWTGTAMAAAPKLPVRLDVSANAAGLFGGTLRDVHAVLLLGQDGTLVQPADATLPGNAALHFSGAARAGPRGATLAGALHAQLPNVPATWAWLRHDMPAGLAAATALLPRQADIGGDLAVSAEGFGLKNVQATLDGALVQGALSMSAGKRPAVAATLTADRIDATAWLPDLPARRMDIAAALAQIDATLDLKAAQVTLPGMSLTRVALGAAAGGAGVAVSHLAADLQGGHVEASGRLAPDGTVADTRLNLDAPDAAMLPAVWRVLPGLWHGPLHLALDAAGAANKIGLQARCDIGDLRAELDGTASLPGSTLSGTVTLRHPGAPRLLRDAGLADAGRWLDQGSVAVIVHFSAAPDGVDVPDFSVAAAALRLSGAARLDFAGPLPRIDASIDAPVLTLPAFSPPWDTKLPFGLLAGWQGKMHVAAAQVISDLAPVATGLDAVVASSGGVVATDVKAAVDGGTVRGAVALDSSAPMLAARGDVSAAELEAAWKQPWDWAAGTADASFDVTASGYSPAALLATLSGTVQGRLHAAVLRGIDLPGATALLAARKPKLKAALMSAMAAGDTGALSGDFDGTLDHGALALAAHDLNGDAGQVDLAANLDLPARTEDAAAHVRPAVTAPPTLGVRLVGPWQQPRRIVDITDALTWAGGLPAETTSGFCLRRAGGVVRSTPSRDAPLHPPPACRRRR